MWRAGASPTEPRPNGIASSTEQRAGRATVAHPGSPSPVRHFRFRARQRQADARRRRRPGRRGALVHRLLGVRPHESRLPEQPHLAGVQAQNRCGAHRFERRIADRPYRRRLFLDPGRPWQYRRTRTRGSDLPNARRHRHRVILVDGQRRHPPDLRHEQHRRGERRVLRRQRQLDATALTRPTPSGPRASGWWRRLPWRGRRPADCPLRQPDPAWWSAPGSPVARRRPRAR